MCLKSSYIYGKKSQFSQELSEISDSEEEELQQLFNEWTERKLTSNYIEMNNFIISFC